MTCRCKRHEESCGCLTKSFIEQSRNNFSRILTESQSAEEFAKRLRALYHHACDEHEWEGGECEFHSKTVCSCGKCPEHGNHECTGKPYKTKNKLTCQFHSLAYKIDIENRAALADSLVHPLLKRGHSNFPEASHNVLIRFRSKSIFLERLHYQLSTDLGLLQANMTYDRKIKGSEYHWIPDLYKRLALPVYDGVQVALEKFGRAREKSLEKVKTEKVKQRRIKLKRDRKSEQEQRKVWSEKHGGDTYGMKRKRKPKLCKAGEPKVCKSCGSSTHSRTTYRDCPYNKRKQQSSQVNSFAFSSDEPPASSDESPGDASTSDESSIMGDLRHCDEQPPCICNSVGAHKADCPLNSRNLYPKRKLTRKTFHLGDYCIVHVAKKHLTCRVVDAQNNRYRLCYRGGILLKNFSSSDMMISRKLFLVFVLKCFCEHFKLFKFFQLLQVSPCSMTTTYHDFGIWKALLHSIARRGVGILPVYFQLNASILNVRVIFPGTRFRTRI